MNIENSLDEITERFLVQFKGLSSPELNWKPSPEKWSIAQILDHIITINESYYPTFDALLKDEYKLSFLAKIGFLVNWFGNIILKSVEPNRRKKIKTFSIWEPSKSDINEDILNHFLIHQKELKKRLSQLEKHIEDGSVIASPANKNIVYKLSKAIEIIISHEIRHYNQAVDIYQIIKQES